MSAFAAGSMRTSSWRDGLRLTWKFRYSKTVRLVTNEFVSVTEFVFPGCARFSGAVSGQLSRVLSTMARSWSTASGISLAISRLSSGGCASA